MTVHADLVESHEIHRDRLLARAEERLAAGDRLQASEKIWGAVAHAVKAIAHERGWRFDRHRDLKRTVRHIAAQVGDQEINTLFRSAESFHSNFYNDTYALDEFREGVAEARRLIRLLREANAAMGLARRRREESPRKRPAPPNRRALPAAAPRAKGLREDARLVLCSRARIAPQFQLRGRRSASVWPVRKSRLRHSRLLSRWERPA